MDTNLKSIAKAVWWLVLLRGIFMAIFGIIALVSPGIALLTLVWLARPDARRPPPRAALWCGTVLAALIGAMALGVCAIVGYLVTSDSPETGEFGFIGPRASFFELFGVRVATSLLLADLMATDDEVYVTVDVDPDAHVPSDAGTATVSESCTPRAR